MDIINLVEDPNCTGLPIQDIFLKPDTTHLLVAWSVPIRGSHKEQKNEMSYNGSSTNQESPAKEKSYYYFVLLFLGATFCGIISTNPP